ncbi:3-hydroxyacyl-CoA dehydrogenase NAD-binding domain-containing protein [Paraburkholderia sp. D1E]|uniref:3-hydroxyacyl-CoA dehydrogenase NAD-binding domain-containing protein n=1 Tax=Paraburkholderia sp. D1E TaxID=3461398 RepID=UPI004046162B
MYRTRVFIFSAPILSLREIRVSIIERTVSGIAILQIDSPPVNAFGGAVRAALARGLAAACAAPDINAIVLCGTTLFSAGADITEFSGDKVRLKPMLWDLFTLLEASPKPVVAAVDGLALGGGTECILATDYRIATPSARFGLPEVKLGILPGAGGTQRLPRLIGPQAAIDLMTRGHTIDAQQALALGMIDAIAEDLLSEAIARAKAIAATGNRPTAALRRTDKVSGFDRAYFAEQRSKAVAKARGLAAPAAIVDCVEAACTLPPREGLRFERSLLDALRANPQHMALTTLFQAERAAAKVPHLVATPAPVSRVAVIGAGTMGVGIAMAFANAGVDVVLSEVDTAAVQRGLSTIGQNYENAVSRKAIDRDAADAARARIEPAVGLEALGPVDLVVEAIPEEMALKQQLFATLDRVTPQHTILGTNTSSLDIDEIAKTTSRPGKVVGVHFFAPANVMKLLENVRGSLTDDTTIATVMALGKRLGKVSVLAGNCDGFIGNRMLHYYSCSAEFMVEHGIAPTRIDAVAEAFGMPMGPLALRDLVGLDVTVLVRKQRMARQPLGTRTPLVVEALHAAGRLGMKSGKGFYRYEGRRRLPDPDVTTILEEHVRRNGFARLALTDQQILDRLLLPLVNEGAKELADGTAIREGDIDVVWSSGYGFPRHEGGPMYWGRRVGLERVKAMADELGQCFGANWMPASNLDGLLKSH